MHYESMTVVWTLDGTLDAGRWTAALAALVATSPGCTSRVVEHGMAWHGMSMSMCGREIRSYPQHNGQWTLHCLSLRSMTSRGGSPR